MTSTKVVRCVVREGHTRKLGNYQALNDDAGTTSTNAAGAWIFSDRASAKTWAGKTCRVVNLVPKKPKTVDLQAKAAEERSITELQQTKEVLTRAWRDAERRAEVAEALVKDWEACAVDYAAARVTLARISGTLCDVGNIQVEPLAAGVAEMARKLKGFST